MSAPLNNRNHLKYPPGGSEKVTFTTEGMVGIGETDPGSDLEVTGTDGVLFTGTFGSGTIPASGAGTRMMWYPGKAAFRTGEVTGNHWDNNNIGIHSVAWGYNTKASGGCSIAMGNDTKASGNFSTAMGTETEASGNFSTAMGTETEASGGCSIAMGNDTKASGDMSTAMGYETTASGSYSTAMGCGTIASGNWSTAMGDFVSTNGKTGSFIIGDRSGWSDDITQSSADNQMTMIFTGGYRLFTNDAANVGVALAA